MSIKRSRGPDGVLGFPDAPDSSELAALLTQNQQSMPNAVDLHALTAVAGGGPTVLQLTNSTLSNVVQTTAVPTGSTGHVLAIQTSPAGPILGWEKIGASSLTYANEAVASGPDKTLINITAANNALLANGTQLLTRAGGPLGGQPAGQPAWTNILPTPQGGVLAINSSAQITSVDTSNAAVNDVLTVNSINPVVLGWSMSNAPSLPIDVVTGVLNPSYWVWQQGSMGMEQQGTNLLTQGTTTIHLMSVLALNNIDNLPYNRLTFSINTTGLQISHTEIPEEYEPDSIPNFSLQVSFTGEVELPNMYQAQSYVSLTPRTGPPGTLPWDIQNVGWKGNLNVMANWCRILPLGYNGFPGYEFMIQRYDAFNYQATTEEDLSWLTGVNWDITVICVIDTDQ